MGSMAGSKKMDLSLCGLLVHSSHLALQEQVEKESTEWRKPLGMRLIQRSQIQRNLLLKSQCVLIERRHLKRRTLEKLVYRKHPQMVKQMVQQGLHLAKKMKMRTLIYQSLTQILIHLKTPSMIFNSKETVDCVQKSLTHS